MAVWAKASVAAPRLLGFAFWILADGIWVTVLSLLCVGQVAVCAMGVSLVRSIPTECVCERACVCM